MYVSQRPMLVAVVGQKLPIVFRPYTGLMLTVTGLWWASGIRRSISELFGLLVRNLDHSFNRPAHARAYRAASASVKT
jgi:hypothetical protein